MQGGSWIKDLGKSESRVSGGLGLHSVEAGVEAQAGVGGWWA